MSLNKVMLIGRLGKDVELKYTPTSQAVANFTLATSEKFTSKDGQRQEKTEWHNIVAWGKQAELANQYLKKGREVYIEGRIETRSWDDRDGNKRYRTEIRADRILFIGSKDGGGGQSQGGGGYSAGASAPSGYGAGSGASSVRQAPAADDFGQDPGPQSEPPVDISDDDLPF